MATFEKRAVVSGGLVALRECRCPSCPNGGKHDFDYYDVSIKLQYIGLLEGHHHVVFTEFENLIMDVFPGDIVGVRWVNGPRITEIEDEQG